MADQDEQQRILKAQQDAKRAETTSFIHKTFADPEFRKLDGKDKIRVMEQYDPEFAAIPEIGDKARVVQSYMYQIPTGPPSTGSAWKDFLGGIEAGLWQPVYYGGDILRAGTENAAKKLGISEEAVRKAGLGRRSEEEKLMEQYMVTPPASKAGKAGEVVEPILELALAPEVQATKIPKLLKSGQTLMRAGKPVLRETLTSVAKRSAVEAGKMGVQSELHGDDPLVGAAIGGAIPIVGRTLNAIVKPEIQRSAEWLYNRALNPTKAVTKAETQEVVPELLQKRYWKVTWPRMHEDVKARTFAAGKKVEEVEDKIVADYNKTYVPTGRSRWQYKPGTKPTPGPTIDIYGGEAAPPGAPRIGVGEQVGPAGPNIGPRAGPQGSGGRAGSWQRVFDTQKGAFSLRPVLDALRDVMQKSTVRGAFPTEQSQKLFAAAYNQYARLAQYGRSVTLKEAIAIRRILDKPLGEKGTFYLDPAWQSLERVQEIAANKLRGLLNDEFPELKAANQEFHIWKTTDTIMNATEQRRIGQIPVVHLLATHAVATAAGAGWGALHDKDWQSAVSDALMANALVALGTSTGAKTGTAVMFDSIADALDRRDVEGFFQAAGTVMRPRQESRFEDLNIPPPIPEKARGRGGSFPPAIVPEEQPPAPGTPQNPEGLQSLRSATPVQNQAPTQGSQEGQEAAPSQSPSRSPGGSAGRSPAPPGVRGAAGRDRAGTFTPDVSRQIAETGRQIGGAQMPELPRIMQLVAAQESSGRQTDPRTGRTLTSPKGALGIGQLMPETARTYGVDPNNPADNVKGMGLLLKDLIGEFGSDVAGLPKVFAAYHAGAGPVRKHNGVPPRKDYPLTYQYVVDMMGRMGYEWPPSQRRPSAFR